MAEGHKVQWSSVASTEFKRLRAGLDAVAQSELDRALEEFTVALPDPSAPGRFLGVHHREHVHRYTLDHRLMHICVIGHGIAVIFAEAASAGKPSVLWFATFRQLTTEALAEYWATG